MNWQRTLTRLTGNDSRILRDGIRVLAQAQPRKHPLSLSEQPFDSHLLKASRLWLRSRKTFLEQGGSFYPTLVSSPRTLTSPILVEQKIEYSPIERELIWAATDPVESANSSSLKTLLLTRTFCTSLFHEQNHRILWNFLPAPTRSEKEVGRYLNAVESLVVALDMALGDELTHGVARVFYLSGITYNPGTNIHADRFSKRAYRNYLHASLYTTYLKLQMYDDEDIRKVVHALFPGDGEHKRLTERAIRRSLRLDDMFVRITNPMWQEKHIKTVIKTLGRKGPKTLRFPENAMDNHLHYLWAEQWFEFMGL
jgi:hypothetical protein